MTKWRPSLSARIDYSKLSLTSEEGFMLSRIDGSTTTEELAQLTGTSELELILSLGKLVDKGALEGGLVAAACILEARKHAPAPAPEPVPTPALDIGWPEDPTQVDPEEPEPTPPFAEDPAAQRAGPFDAETEETSAPEFEDGGGTLVDEEPEEDDVPTQEIPPPRAPGEDPEV